MKRIGFPSAIRLCSWVVAAVMGWGCALSASFGAEQGSRHALVIGNAAYRDAPLANPVNDARAVAEALKAGGFQVILRENLDHRAMVGAVREFGDRLRGGGVGLFYFAGHGMQIKGRNYLVPVAATIQREDEVAYAALDAQAIMDKMEAAGNGTNIVVLDACRNNPFSRSFRSSTLGLAQMDAPVGTLVAFATAPGSVSSDGDGRNGLYTRHLLASMREPGLKVEDVFKRTRVAVRRESQGKQIPWESTSLEGDVYFLPQSRPPPPVANSPQSALDQAMWDMVRGSRQPVELRAYLSKFPQGKYAAQARGRLAALEGAPAPAARLVPEPAASAPPKSPPKVAAAPRLPASADKTAVRPRNPNGFTVGDRWRYQIVDKYKGEVVDNYAWRVDRIFPNGDMGWNGKGIVTTPEGNQRSNVHSAWPARDWTSDDTLVPREVRTGYRQDVKFSLKASRRDGYSFMERYSGTLVVKGREKVTVPAGEFNAWRIERDTTFSGEQANGKSRWFGRNLVVGWYVPELRNFVARDTEHRVGNRVATRARHEMTSFEVNGFKAAQR